MCLSLCAKTHCCRPCMCKSLNILYCESLALIFTEVCVFCCGILMCSTFLMNGTTLLTYWYDVGVKAPLLITWVFVNRTAWGIIRVSWKPDHDNCCISTVMGEETTKNDDRKYISWTGSQWPEVYWTGSVEHLQTFVSVNRKLWTVTLNNHFYTFGIYKLLNKTIY